MTESKAIEQPKAHTDKLPFDLPVEARSRVEISHVPITVTKITEHINQLIDQETMQALPNHAISNWLLSSGLLESVSLEDGSIRRRPTPQGEAVGIFWKTGTNSKKEPYVITLYTAEAQQFVVDNLDAIVALDRSGDKRYMAGKPQREIKREEIVHQQPAGEKRLRFAVPEERRAHIGLSSDPISVREIAERINGVIDQKTMHPLDTRSINGWLFSMGLLERSTAVTGEIRAVPTAKGEERGIFWKTGTNAKGAYALTLFSPAAQQYILEHLDDIVEYNSPKRPSAAQSASGQAAEPGQAASREETEKQPFALSPQARSAIELSDTPISISDIADRINRPIDPATMHILPHRTISDWLIFVGLLQQGQPDDSVGGIKKMRLPTPQGEKMGIFLGWNKPYGAYRKQIVRYPLAAQRFIVEHLDDIIAFAGGKPGK